MNLSDPKNSGAPRETEKFAQQLSSASSATSNTWEDPSSANSNPGLHKRTSSRDSFPLPAPRLSLDLEPNPFELSFKKREDASVPGPSSSTQPANAGPIGPQFVATPGGRRHMLPPVASISSPQSLLSNPTTPGLGWMNSLKSGPLSPVILPGPQGPGITQGPSNLGSNLGPHNTHTDQHIPVTQSLPGPGTLSPFTPSMSSALFPNPGPATAALLNLNAEQTSLMGSTGLTPLGLTSTLPKDDILPPTTLANATTHAPIIPVPTPLTSAPNLPLVANGTFPTALSQAIATSTVKAVNEQQQRKQDGLNRNDPTDAANSLYMLSRSSNDNEESAEHADLRNTRGKKNMKRREAIKTEDFPLPKKAKTSKNGFKHPSPDSLSPPPEGRQKLTEEEKRKSFLERNRVAALKCRQRKKQWLESLQAKVEYYSSENETLTTEIATLSGEVQKLKTMLLQHKDCQLGMTKEALASILNVSLPNDMSSNPKSLQHQAKAVAAAAAASQVSIADLAPSQALAAQPMMAPMMQGQVPGGILNPALVRQEQGPIGANPPSAYVGATQPMVAQQMLQPTNGMPMAGLQPQQQRDFRFVM